MDKAQGSTQTRQPFRYVFLRDRAITEQQACPHRAGYAERSRCEQRSRSHWSTREQFSALSGDPRLRWLGIASGLWANSQDLRQYRAKNKVTIPLTLDSTGEVFREFRVNDVPTVLIADAGGRIVRRIDGSAAQD